MSGNVSVSKNKAATLQEAAEYVHLHSDKFLLQKMENTFVIPSVLKKSKKSNPVY